MKKILVVEDSALHQKIYDVTLGPYRSQGVSILHAANGLEGMVTLSAHPDIDLVILDINMPVMSGLEFLDHLRAQESFRDIPALICSTEGKDEDILRGLQKGAQGYIKKPFKAQELIAMIQRVLGAREDGMECQRP